MAPRNFKNIQVMAHPDLANQFNDVFEQSGTNSKGEFLSVLLESYLNPDYETKVNQVKSELSKKESTVKNLNDALSASEGVNDELQTELALFYDILTPILEKHQGKDVDVKDSSTGKVETVKINTEFDVFQVIMKSVKIK